MDDYPDLMTLDGFLEEFKTWEREGLAKEPWPSLRAVPPNDIQELMITGLRDRVASGDLDEDIAVGVACGRMEMLIKEKVASPVTPADKARMLQIFAARDAEEVAKSKEVKAIASLIP